MLREVASVLETTYAERHGWWCERSVNTKVGDKRLRLVFISYSIVFSVVVAWIVVLGAGAFLDEPFGGLLVVGYVYRNTGILAGSLRGGIFLFAVVIHNRKFLFCIDNAGGVPAVHGQCW